MTIAEIARSVRSSSPTSSNSRSRRCAPSTAGSRWKRAIVTSRDTLAMLDARLLELAVLDNEDSVRLMDRVLQVARPGDSRVATEPVAATQIAEFCAGLPLAVQIVSALLAEDPNRPLRTMGDELATEHTRLGEMCYADVAVRAALGLSYQRLDPPPARLFRLLPVNPGPDISAAAALAGTDQSTARHLLEALRRPGQTNLERYQVKPGRCCVLGWEPTRLVRLLLFR